MSGTLLSQSFAETILPAAFKGRLGEDGRARGLKAVRSWWRNEGRQLGPASSMRDLLDRGAAPLLEALGHRPALPEVSSDPPQVTAVLGSGVARAGLLIGPWGAPLSAAGTGLARHASRVHAGWGISFNGTALRLVDLRRAFERRHVEFDLESALEHPASFGLLWACARAEASGPLVEAIVDASTRHGVGVCASLRTGVVEAVEWLMQAMLGGASRRRLREPTPAGVAAAYEQAITIVYRILFLLFAESRSLVPGWNRVYREGYSTLALRTQAERPGGAHGLWEMLQAQSRLAHMGCLAGDLRVTAFNGRLFSPLWTPLAEVPSVDDDLVGRAVVALTTRAGASGRERIAFGDLGVEQLGAVYESVLDYEPVVTSQPARAQRADSAPGRPFVRLSGTGTRRKASGSFYTPAAMTDYLVHETLGPLVEHATAEEIARLKVVDPAMGSGAFLVAACRFLADAYERAVVRDTGRMASDITEDERAGFRRLVAQRCLYGVDVNPMAVQVARLSMWLTTLAADQPLSFLDHHFATGDSLVGASLDDIARQRPGPSRPGRPPENLLPFDPEDVGLALGRVLPVRARMASLPDDSPAVVRNKEADLRQIAGARSPIAPLVRLADAWCAWWFWEDGGIARPRAAEYSDLLSAARGEAASLPARLIEPRLEAVRGLARTRRFLHWPLAFPEVFYASSGEPLPEPGFDAVIGNPPWEMIRGDTGAAAERSAARRLAKQLIRFARESGVYRAGGSGHLNLYQLFVERALRLARRGGRVGLVLPWGLASDHGSAGLRRFLFERCDTERLVGFDNSGGIFPVHRGVRFLLLTSSPGAPTRELRCRLGLREVGALDRPEAPAPGGSQPPAGECVVTPRLLGRLSGSRLAVPWIRCREDLLLLERLASRFAPLGDPAGWHARFGRELNATDDRDLFEPLPAGWTAANVEPGSARRQGTTPPWRGLVIEGRQIGPFHVDCRASRLCLKTGARLRPDVAATARRWRLGYRDVASPSNRLTVIAGLVPPGAVTVHTVFCLKPPLPLRDQACLCALLNSLVVNFLARLWVATHVTTDIIERIPAPARAEGARGFDQAARLSQHLSRQPGDTAAYARVQAVVGRLYGLSSREMSHVVGAFPLIEPGLRSRILEAFESPGSEV